MTWHIVTRSGHLPPAVPLNTLDAQLTIEVTFDTPERPEFRATTMLNDLRRYQPVLSPVLLELLQAAAAAYTADVRVPRSSAYDSWTRDISLHLGVEDASRWQEAQATLARILGFLTGDHWSVSVTGGLAVQQPALPRPRQPLTANPEKVSLFSGGLDSFIGALNLLTQGTPTVLCGHYARGGGTGKSQNTAIQAIRTHTRQHVPYIRYAVGPRGGDNRASEITTRGRSIIFLATGALTASALGARTLVVPENGFISLNVPLTPARVGSFSTKTTHPHLISLFQTLLDQLGIDVRLEVPYRFQTKREMLNNCADPSGIGSAMHATMSCAHPGASRFETHDSNLHCGYCFPCLIRRAAYPAGDPTHYWKPISDPLTETTGADRRAVQLALLRHQRRPADIFDVLKPGPLPASLLPDFVGVYSRGLRELDTLLSTAP
jgi:7-cyano-7-deazaguanine synthase in queuosine biosynthesis